MAIPTVLGSYQSDSSPWMMQRQLPFDRYLYFFGEVGLVLAEEITGHDGCRQMSGQRIPAQSHGRVHKVPGTSTGS